MTDAVRVAILLSAFNGQRFLNEQLGSILAQTHQDWRLYWRDDGSSDATAALLAAFAKGPGRGRCQAVPPSGHLGVTPSFFALLRAAMVDGPRVVAFADQDDVWLPDKLARALDTLAGVPPAMPALYCARQVLVDERLARIAMSSRLRRSPSFPAALTQNIATGCTVVLNPTAACLVDASHPPPATLHDWWSYLLVAGAGGLMLTDERPVVLYRQHKGSFVGAPRSLARRALAAVRRGPGVFMGVMRQHVAALSAQPHLLSTEAQAQLEVIAKALDRGAALRFRALRLRGFHRQTWPETLLLRIWFLTG